MGDIKKAKEWDQSDWSQMFIALSYMIVSGKLEGVYGKRVLVRNEHPSYGFEISSIECTVFDEEDGDYVVKIGDAFMRYGDSKEFKFSSFFHNPAKHLFNLFKGEETEVLRSRDEVCESLKHSLEEPFLYDLS